MLIPRIVLLLHYRIHIDLHVHILPKLYWLLKWFLLLLGKLTFYKSALFVISWNYLVAFWDGLVALVKRRIDKTRFWGKSFEKHFGLVGVMGKYHRRLFHQGVVHSYGNVMAVVSFIIIQVYLYQLLQRSCLLASISSRHTYCCKSSLSPFSFRFKH